MHLRLARRCLGAVGVLFLVGLELVVAVEVRHQWHGLGTATATVADAVSLAASATALALGLWLLAGLGTTLLGLAPGRLGRLGRLAARACAPAVTRRWAALLIGATLGAGTGLGGGVAWAADAGAPASVSSPSVPGLPGPGFAPTPGRSSTQHAGQRVQGVSGASVPQPGWTPTRPAPHPHAEPRLVSAAATRGAAGGAPGTAGAARGEVVVHRGDTLWHLVRRALGPEASDLEVARVWPQWYAANRAVIGEDPGLILPGQRLRPPSFSRASGSTRAASSGAGRR